MQRSFRAAPFALVLALSSVAACQSASPVRVALTHATVIDGTGAAPLRDRTILIDRGRITAVQPSTVAVPEGYATRDLSGRYVIPGLIDTHVHLGTQPRPEGVMETILRNAFLGGVTSVRDMGGQAETVIRLANLSRADSAPIPRVVYSTIVAGPGMWLEGERAQHFTGSGVAGQTPTVRMLLTEADVQPAIAAAKAAGSSGIKIYNSIDLALIRAVSAEAKRRGLRVWSHTWVDPNPPTAMIDAGSEVLSHGDMFVAEVVSETARRAGGNVYRQARQVAYADTSLVGSARVRDLIARMKQRDVVFEPTLFVMTPRDSQGRVDSRPGTLFDNAVRFTAAAHRAGVDIAAGTDAIGGSTPNLHVELQLLVDQVGMTPLQAIRAGTFVAARALGIDDSVGTIAAGKQGDLVILAGDPSVDIANTITVLAVMRGGHLVERSRPMPTPPGARGPRN